MASKKKYKPDDKAQSERYIETARKVGVDETGEEFERAFRKIVSPKPKADRSRQGEKPTSE